MSKALRIGTVLANSGHQAAQLIRERAAQGFRSFQLAYKNTLGATNLEKLADETQKACSETGTLISCLGIYGNTLAPDAHGQEIRDALAQMILFAPRFGTDLVCCFTGRVTGRPIPESIDRFKEVFGPLADTAGTQGVRLAFENCLQGGNWQTGDRNIAHNPTAWNLMFEALSQRNLGLQWEPAHQMCQLIDPLRQLRDWAPRVFHVHGKDAEVRADLIAQYGVHSPEWFAWHRFPGLGDSNWAKIISELVRAGYQGTIDIEGGHDPVYRGEMELAGQLIALRHLTACGGNG